MLLLSLLFVITLTQGICSHAQETTHVSRVHTFAAILWFYATCNVNSYVECFIVLV
jgi:hypothetical protein